MTKHYTKYVLILCLLSSNVASSSPTIVQTIKNASLDCASLLWSCKDKLLVASLIAGSGYVTILSFIKATKYRAEKEAIQDSIPCLKQYISELKKIARKWQNALGHDWHVSLRYEKIYENVLNRNSDQYKNIMRLYTAERNFSVLGALSLMTCIGLCCYLHSIINQNDRYCCY